MTHIREPLDGTFHTFRSCERKLPREINKSFEAFPCGYRHVSQVHLGMYCVRVLWGGFLPSPELSICADVRRNSTNIIHEHKSKTTKTYHMTPRF